ncbi:RNA-directed DNA polymerase [Sinorhizobium sp. 7-81]|uniref:RNA-directed DNA polymerase n=1 Tax=Sinorhizobium sp. 8-89 TaxID=3049089 RepID=UPI0024C2A899|nr:RNA-directed DNA polymerase [Sinorhizobium sp. 8-89]MDK1494486.1 RNA-directed DNA polymerase [Sinorhizobium sp. 8-89]
MQRLIPTLEQVTQEYVLVQAWKKAASYIRYHNWFADTLELDRAAADLPKFMAKVSERLRAVAYQSDHLRLVPAPKSQRWQVDDSGQWGPIKTGTAKIRPLARVTLQDQVAATAIMLCLSERVETAQGDPLGDYRTAAVRRSVISYGNRLFCDPSESGHGLIHRWGSSKLYRAYFQDYRAFLNRPEAVAASLDGIQEILIIQSDLSQFYDRVTPEELHKKLRQLQTPDDDNRFFELAEHVLNWTWSIADRQKIERYRRRAEIPDFKKVALPQGLVAAGFFSNVVMLDFDKTLLGQLDAEIAPGVWLRDACRYVDDVRLTIAVAPGVTQVDAQERTMAWLQSQLETTTAGLQFSADKTVTASVGGRRQPLVRQSRKMERIQTAISGGFDASGGEEVIQAIEALVRSQSNLSRTAGTREPSPLRAISDVKDETVGRFAAGRFRKTFRSLRPLLDHGSVADDPEVGEETFRRSRLSQSELDDEAHAFALMLIERWIADPANVRLLRVALDLWPSPEVLGAVLRLFESYLTGQGGREESRQIIHYCMAELLRAGATETGFIEDQDCLPHGVDIDGYRSLLLKTALRVVSGQEFLPPWYLTQQALLFIAVHGPSSIALPKATRQNPKYWGMIAFLQGDHRDLSNREYAILAVVSRRSFLSVDRAIALIRHSLTPSRFASIAKRDIEFAHDLYRAVGKEVNVSIAAAFDMGTTDPSDASDMLTLHMIVRQQGALNPIRNEIGVLSFAEKFLDSVATGAAPNLVTPSTINVSIETVGSYARVKQIELENFEFPKSYRSIYSAPSWCANDQRWRFQLGYLLRYILTARIDFSLPVYPPSWKEAEPLYRPTRGHWIQRQYSFYNGHEAFGDDWLPISQFTQDLLFSLLRWPGCRPRQGDGMELSLHEAQRKVREGLSAAYEAIGPATGVLILRAAAPIPGAQKNGRPLRACVVQSIMPEQKDFSAADLEMSSPGLRKKHRKHLSTALAAVEKMLDLRETHKPENKRLDWLIFPELSVHPDDVNTHLIPFARAFKTAILAGIAYERLVPGQPLVNSALWIIPRVVPGQGLQTIVRRQGKQHLSPMETPFSPHIFGFRPCQWLVGYEWSPDVGKDPLWLTASICYDATDLKLASDLRDKSDVFAIPALNQDVGTFDQMAQALHYHMFQMVLIANNGGYGGSNAHLPKGEAYERQVFHTHGQPQATISFFEIDNIEDMKSRRQNGVNKVGKWKYPPAGG